MEKKNEKPKKRKAGFVWLVTLAVLFSLAAALSLGVWAWADSQIDREADARLFGAMGHSSTTVVYEVTDPASFGALGPIVGQNVEVYDLVYGAENSRWAPSEDIPQTLSGAFVSVEDHRFFSHGGIDYYRTARAAANAVLHFAPHFGGSTITQQVVKNVTGERDVTSARKIKEMIRARRLEKSYTKDEILNMYLNIVPMGHHCVGVASAADYYFGKKCAELTPAECASLAAVTNSPVRYDPLTHPETHIERRNMILDLMVRYGYLEEEVAREAQDTPLTLSPGAGVSDTSVHDWYTETVLRDVEMALMDTYGMNEGVASAMVWGGGLSIYAAVDREAQQILESEWSAWEGREDLTGAFVLAEPQTGRLLAVMGNTCAKTGNRLYNGATEWKRPPGSAIKPITLYAPAIEAEKVTWATPFLDVPGDGGPNADWPHNADFVYAGHITLADALAASKNTVAVQLLDIVGRETAYAAATRAGLTSLERGRTTESGRFVSDLEAAPLALGQLTDGVTLREMTYAYAPFANGGVLPASFSFYSVRDDGGHALLSLASERTQVWSAGTAAVMTQMLQGVTERGTARSLSLPHDVATAGKTGTTGGGADRWFVGYTPTVLGGIRLTSADGSSACPIPQKSMLSVWDKVMRRVCDERNARWSEPSEFAVPANVKRALYCRDGGGVPTEACHDDCRGDRSAWGFFLEGTAPAATCSLHEYAWVDPDTGDRFATSVEGCERLAGYSGVPTPREIEAETLDLSVYLWYDSDSGEIITPSTESPEDGGRYPSLREWLEHFFGPMWPFGKYGKE